MIHPFSYYQNRSSKDLNDILCTACRRGRIDKLRYMLTTPEISKKIDIHHRNAICFDWMLYSKRFEVLKYLIFEYKIEKTKDIDDCLKKDHGLICQEVIKMFEMRDLQLDLSSELKNREVGIKKVKI